jgi:type I restriction enzyme S subunit
MSYKRLGEHIQIINKRNKDLEVATLLGVSVKKKFIPSIANTVGTDFKKYKIVEKSQFVYIPDTSRRGEKIGVAMLESHSIALVSQAYTVFEIKDQNKLLSEYLMMWFRRPEFDRYARVKSHGSVREIFDWEEMCSIELPIPSIEKQQQIVAEYNTVTNRINLNNQLNQKLEETAQALYKHWFVDNNSCELTTLKDCVTSANTGLDAIKRAPIVNKDTGIKCLRIQDVSRNKRFDNWGFTNVSLINYEKFQLKKNDLIIARTGATVGVTMFIKKDLKSVFNNGLIRIRANQNSIHSTFLYSIFKTKQFKKHIQTISFGTATQPNMKINELLSYEFSIPKIEVQNDLVECFLTLDNQTMINEDINNSLVELQNLLLAKMTQQETKLQAV